jgi:hypothetical protein
MERGEQWKNTIRTEMANDTWDRTGQERSHRWTHFFSKWKSPHSLERGLVVWNSLGVAG